jgi:hypothetical protein
MQSRGYTAPALFASPPFPVPTCGGPYTQSLLHVGELPKQCELTIPLFPNLVTIVLRLSEGGKKAVKSKYLDLETGEVLNAKQLLAFEKGKDKIWKAADELRLLLSNIADDKEQEAHGLLVEVEVIRDYLKKYDDAEASFDIRAKESKRAPETRGA